LAVSFIGGGKRLAVSFIGGGKRVAVSFIGPNKTNRQDITEILFKVALTP
jgi:hypothetical protein